MYRRNDCLSINSSYFVITLSMSCTSRGQHLWRNNFYTHKNRISTILSIFLFIFDVFVQNLEKITAGTLPIHRFLYKFVSYNPLSQI